MPVRQTFHLSGLTDVGEFAVLPDQKVVLVCEGLELLDEVAVKVLDNVDMRLHTRFVSFPMRMILAGVGKCTFMQQQ